MVFSIALVDLRAPKLAQQSSIQTLSILFANCTSLPVSLPG
jgi:hypothetical protein